MNQQSTAAEQLAGERDETSHAKRSKTDGSATIDEALPEDCGTILHWFYKQLLAGECTLEAAGLPVPFFAAKPVEVDSQLLVDAFNTLLKTNQELAKHCDFEEYDIKFSQLATVERLTKNFDECFGKNVINNVRGVYAVPAVDVLRKTFADVTMGNPECDWTQDSDSEDD